MYTQTELDTLSYAQSAAKELISKHLDSSWTFQWNNRKRAFGLCNYTDRTIELSRIMTANQSREQILDTILHECAHALTPGKGHGPEWKRMARQLGCVPKSTGRLSEDGQEKLSQVAPWAMMFGDEVVRVFHKRPTRTMQKLSSMYLRGRKSETYGKLRIVPNPQFKR